VPDNPFVYGEIAPREAFVDREVELDRLVSDLLGGQKVFLISPRRFGKSSLVHQALRAAARAGALTVDVVVSSYSSYIAFLEGYARALLAVETRADRLASWLRELFTGVRPELRVEADAAGAGRFAVTFPTVRTPRDAARLAAEVFDLPARVARARRRRVVVALDEFQAIAAFDGGQVEHALRAAIERQRQVGYVFAGSEPALMERMLERRRPFYRAGPVVRLGRVPADRFAEFIERRFRQTGFRPEPGLGAAIVELAGNLPYDVQRLAHETWDDATMAGRRAVGVEELHATLKRLLAEHETLFEQAWQSLTLAQRAVLRAAVLEEGRHLLSADVRTRYRLSGASSVQAALTALVRLGWLMREGDRYVPVDSLMREWVARKTR
jgi:phenylpyruvate tautomerase PptA (4-oxalocrotonate tautomerase family)